MLYMLRGLDLFLYSFVPLRMRTSAIMLHNHIGIGLEVSKVGDCNQPRIF
jgi:hypothetical protein